MIQPVLWRCEDTEGQGLGDRGTSQSRSPDLRICALSPISGLSGLTPFLILCLLCNQGQRVVGVEFIYLDVFYVLCRSELGPVGRGSF